MNSHVNPPALEGVQVTEFIRETSVSTTWRGHQDSLDRAVFICSLNEDAATERDRFRSIARAIAKIKHPNIIHVFDVLDDASGRPCIVFEAVEGSSLQQIVGNGKHLPAAQSCDIALSLASALSATWNAASLVHRNLKPLNVTLTHEGTIKLVEFASAFLATPEGVAEAARSEELVGTPSYMSPEQITSGTDIDFRSDIYGIGALLYRFITGVTPFNDFQEPDQIMRCQLEMTLPSPRALNPKCPPALEAVIARCMMKRPEDRYASYAELIADLTKVKSGASFGDIALPAAPALSTVSVLPPPAPKPVVAKDASRPGSAANPQAATPRKSVSPALSISLYAVLVIGLLVFGAARWNVSEPATTPVSLGPLQPAVAFVQNLLKPVNSPVAVPEEDVPSTPTATEQADSEPQPSTASTTEPATEVAVSVRPDIAPEEPRPATAALTADDVDRTLNDAALALRTGNSRHAMTLLRQLADRSGADAEPYRRAADFLLFMPPVDDICGRRILELHLDTPILIRGVEATPRGYSAGQLAVTVQKQPGAPATEATIPLAKIEPEQRIALLGDLSGEQVRPRYLYAAAMLALSADNPAEVRRLANRLPPIADLLRRTANLPK